jgi:hypothetical protein
MRQATLRAAPADDQTHSREPAPARARPAQLMQPSMAVSPWAGGRRRLHGGTDASRVYGRQRDQGSTPIRSGSFWAEKRSNAQKPASGSPSHLVPTR